MTHVELEGPTLQQSPAGQSDELVQGTGGSTKKALRAWRRSLHVPPPRSAGAAPSLAGPRRRRRSPSTRRLRPRRWNRRRLAGSPGKGGAVPCPSEAHPAHASARSKAAGRIRAPSPGIMRRMARNYPISLTLGLGQQRTRLQRASASGVQPAEASRWRPAAATAERVHQRRARRGGGGPSTPRARGLRRGWRRRGRRRTRRLAPRTPWRRPGLRGARPPRPPLPRSARRPRRRP